MRLRRRAALASLGVAAAIVAMATPAEALLPSTADLVSGDGQVNGCVMSVTITKTTLAGSEDLGRGIFANTVVTCPARADIHRVQFRQNFVEVLGDGAFRAIGQGKTGGVSSADEPITGPVSSGQFTPCSNPDNDGTHVYRVRARVSAKVLPTYQDPDPYVGKAAARETLTC